MPTSRLEIDLAAIGRNYETFRAMLDAPPPSSGASTDPDAPSAAEPTRPRHRKAICAVLKQDGYGLGALRIAKKLAACGTEMLAVYSLDEARALAEAPIATPILVLMPVRTVDRQDPVYRLVVRGRLHFVIHDLEQVGDLAGVGSRLGLRLPVHVQLDTGMSRGGAMAPDARRIIELVLAAPRLQLAGLMTHFSSPATDPEYTREQARAFRAFVDDARPLIAPAIAAYNAAPSGAMLPPAAPMGTGGAQAVAGGIGFAIHAANSAAAIRGRTLHASMVRIGQGLLGYGYESFTDPLAAEFASLAQRLTPVVRWLSRIAHIHEVPAGWPVGYARTHICSRPSRIGLVPVGYADGYPIALSNTGRVSLTGHLYDRQRPGAGERVELYSRPASAPVVGRVSMDQITIDLTGVPESLARVGAEVELFGRDSTAPTHIPTVAALAGTITHDLLCRVGPRVERVYIAPADADEPTPSSTRAPAAITLPSTTAASTGPAPTNAVTRTAITTRPAPGSETSPATTAATTGHTPPAMHSPRRDLSLAAQPA